MGLDFEKYASAGSEVLHQLDKKLGGQGKEHAGRVLRSVLHALRSRLTMQESLQFMAPLPMALKGLYVEGWRFAKPDRHISTPEDFAQAVIEQDGRTAWRDFSNLDEARAAATAVMQVLAGFVPAGEWQDIRAIFPQPLRQEVDQWQKAESVKSSE